MISPDVITRWWERPDLFATEVFGITPDPSQEEAFRAFPTSPRLAMKSAAGTGKTTTLAVLGWNYLCTRPHPKIGATSISGATMKTSLWAELAFWRGKSDFLQRTFEMTTKEIYHREHRETWKLEARTWPQDADVHQIGNVLRGLHADYVMWLLDESGAYPDGLLPVFENIFSGSPTEAHIVQAGNPTSLNGMLYRAAVTERDRWTVIEITGDPHDPKRSPRIPIEHAREQIARWGRDNPWVMVNILGQFPPSSLNALIGPDEVRAAMQPRWREPDIDSAPRVLGVDVAREGDDASVIFPRQGLVAFKPHVMRNVDGNAGAGQVARTWEDWSVDAVFVDNSGGFGASWIDGLKRLNRSPIPVGFAERAMDTRYANRRAEMYFRCAEWIRDGGQLPDVPELVAELSQTTYTFRGDALLLEPKDAIKGRLGRSPDRSDALVLTFAQPVAKAQHRRAPQRPTAAYDPFARLLKTT